MSMATRFLIEGRVQGVGFRVSARREALQLGLAGIARNLADGRVEVVAQGDAAAIEALALWLERGPTHARVDSLQRSEVPASAAITGFAIG
jgi:acylphosphatase